METNSGTFMVEMKETAHILQHATDNSLVLIDELGRGTSNMEGAAIAWSVAEDLLFKKCFTIFATHFVQLCELEFMYANVKNQHFVVNSNTDGLEFAYTLNEGSSGVEHYGISLAKILKLPLAITQQAEKYCDQMVQDEKRKAQEMEAQNDGHLSRNMIRLAYRLRNLKSSTLNFEAMKKQLKTLQQMFKPATSN